MLRLVLLLLYLTASFSGSQPHDIGGGLDPNGLTRVVGGGLDPDGLTAPPPSEWGGGLDPDGRPVPPPSDWGGGLDPNG